MLPLGRFFARVVMALNRRDLLYEMGATALLSSLTPSAIPRAFSASSAKADYSLRIEPTTLDIGRGISIRNVAYNGQFPGPLLRMKEGSPVVIDVTNATATDDIVQWHGLDIGTVPDGAREENLHCKVWAILEAKTTAANHHRRRCFVHRRYDL